MNADPRYLSIRLRLEKLTDKQLRYYLDYDGPIVYDEVNYRAEDGSYCPLSVMLCIPERLKRENIIPTQKIVLEYLQKHEAFGTVKGVAGEFYRDSRESDLKGLCQEILDERKGD